MPGAWRRRQALADIVPRLQNKLCVITGAASGIGRAIAEQFHNEGATVFLTDIDKEAG